MSSGKLAVFAEVRLRSEGRLARSPIGRQYLRTEDFGRCSKAEAFAGRRVEVGAHLVKVAMLDRSIDNGSVSLGSHLRARRLVFSTLPFCHGACGSQNHV